jgi:hypothetical protein
MNLNKFLHFNERCPVCTEPLSLYAQVLDGPLWKAKTPLPGIYHFDQFKCQTNKLKKEDFFWLAENADSCSIDFSTDSIIEAAKKWNLFFFFMCNEDAIEDESGTSYGINPYVACYYRSSPFLELQKQSEDMPWKLAVTTGHTAIDGDIRDEIFIFKDMQNSGDEKVYVLSSDYEHKKTLLRYYSISPEDRKNKYFDPNIFKSKDLPLLSVRPNLELENRPQLISRFNSWILMS